MFRAALTALATLTALPAFALCSGESYLTQLPLPLQAEIATAVEATPNATGLIWTATKADNILTLVGTVHVYDQRLDAVRARVLPAFEDADIMMVEATATEEAAMQEAFIANPDLYLINEGPTLPDLLPPDVWEKVVKAAEDRGLPSFFVAKFQPWYLSLTLGVPACAMTEIAQGARGLDHMLIADAEAASVPLQALEDWETLIDILTDGTQEEQVDLLRLGLIDAADQQALFVAMLDAYFSEQIARVWEVSQVAARELTGMTVEDAAAQMAETQEMLLDTRNRNWIPIIEEATIEHDNIIIAVGAAHLPGEFGLIELLKNAGWTLIRQE
jgi:uncharacterized protein YbaP (TraB family)